MGKRSRAWRVVRKLMEPINEAVILILGLYTTVWGLWLIAPWWSVFSAAPLYSKMASFAPEWAWGTFALASGLAIVWGVAEGHPMSLIRGSLVGWFHWLLICAFYFIGDWKNTGGVTSLTFALLSLVIFLNLNEKNKEGRKQSQSPNSLHF